MKDFCNKHPFITLWIVEIICGTAYSIVRLIKEKDNKQKKVTSDKKGKKKTSDKEIVKEETK